MAEEQNYQKSEPRVPGLAKLVSETSIVAAVTGLLYLGAMQWEAGYQDAIGFDDLSVGIDQITNFVRVIILPVLGCAATLAVIVAIIALWAPKWRGRLPDLVMTILPLAVGGAFLVPNLATVWRDQPAVLKELYWPFVLGYLVLVVMLLIKLWTKPTGDDGWSATQKRAIYAGQVLILVAIFLMIAADLGRISAHSIDNPEYCLIGVAATQDIPSDDCAKHLPKPLWIVVDRKGTQATCARLNSDGTGITRQFARVSVPISGTGALTCGERRSKSLGLSTDLDRR